MGLYYLSNLGVGVTNNEPMEDQSNMAGRGVGPTRTADWIRGEVKAATVRRHIVASRKHLTLCGNPADYPLMHKPAITASASERLSDEWCLQTLAAFTR